MEYTDCFDNTAGQLIPVSSSINLHQILNVTRSNPSRSGSSPILIKRPLLGKEDPSQQCTPRPSCGSYSHSGGSSVRPVAFFPLPLKSCASSDCCPAKGHQALSPTDCPESLFISKGTFGGCEYGQPPCFVGNVQIFLRSTGSGLYSSNGLLYQAHISAADNSRL